MVTVVIPTLAADEALEACLRALGQQTWQSFHIVVVDNSGMGKARRRCGNSTHLTVLENPRNLGFSAAINQGFQQHPAPYLATLNDDTVPSRQWLEQLVTALEADPQAGMAASRIVLAGRAELDSAGMLLCGDGTSKQRGQGQPASRFSQASRVLLPSACAALYRKAMLDQIGLFDEEFFLYCEDTDLGLRAQWAGWECSYVPGAVVEHRYSHSAGRVSHLKAYYVERNRLAVACKNFPLSALLLVVPISAWRYVWHVVAVLRGHGAAGAYQSEHSGAWRLGLMVLRAHWELLRRAPLLWRKRRAIRQTARRTPAAFRCLLRQHHISAREVASL